MNNKGVFISFEGIDGAGKTTLINNLSKRFTRENYPVYTVREPGGTAISEKIRGILLDARNNEMLAKTEVLLYSAARVQLVEAVIKPLLDKGFLVFADRYTDSTIAYQGYGRGLEMTFLNMLNQFCAGLVPPALTFLIDIEPETAAVRKKTENKDRLEKAGLSFQEKVRAGYLNIAKTNPERIRIIEGWRKPAELEKLAAGVIMELMQKNDYN